MIEISFGKLLLLAVIALLVLGPEKLPGAARTAGAMVRRLRNTWDSVRAEVERELEIEEIKRTAREAAARAEAAQKQASEAVGQVREAVAGEVHGITGNAASPDPGEDDEAEALAEAEDADTRTGDLFADRLPNRHEEPPRGDT